MAVNPEEPPVVTWRVEMPTGTSMNTSGGLSPRAHGAASGLRIGSLAITLNPRFLDGTQLRDRGEVDAHFSPFTVPNNVPVVILYVQPEFALIYVREGQTGWIRTSNLQQLDKPEKEYLASQFELAGLPAMSHSLSVTQKKEIVDTLAKSKEKPQVRQLCCIGGKPVTLKDPIGTGAYGQGDWGGTQVAVKCSKSTGRCSTLLPEAATWEKCQHPHVLQFFGTYVDAKGRLCLVAEYAPHGSLSTYLQNEKKHLTILDLVKIAIDTARGMLYLHSMNLIHKDLAARNLLVFEVNGKLRIKVADFGLTQEEGKDTSASQEIPLRWCAPECIEKHQFSRASDIWSFGITLWEIFSYGEKPYGKQIGSQENFLKQLQNKFRLPSPTNCPPQIYELMLRCWSQNPDDRPTFEQIIADLINFIPHRKPKSCTTSESCSEDSDEQEDYTR